ncbi:hypothetical protein M153_4230004727 [Pseudoloma neurophilia]|uniref:Uncharacterized protein n=1 Tax=Pseudoloma neurophilia TaxID=146866 RepID=A0A0R0LXG4_9MICR|nr:hypothetical protein M153_4230004727 [Pseudoloma neurophilia]
MLNIKATQCEPLRIAMVKKNQNTKTDYMVHGTSRWNKGQFITSVFVRQSLVQPVQCGYGKQILKKQVFQHAITLIDDLYF